MVMEIVISVILLFVGIGVLVMIHLCIVGRTFRRRGGINSENTLIERERLDNTMNYRMSNQDLENLPCFEFKTLEKGIVDCAVCLENFKMGGKCRLLPICKHSFHAHCVDSWLLKTPICPICRANAAACSQPKATVSGDDDVSNRSGEVDVRSVVVEPEVSSNSYSLPLHSSSSHLELV